MKKTKEHEQQDIKDWRDGVYTGTNDPIGWNKGIDRRKKPSKQCETKKK